MNFNRLIFSFVLLTFSTAVFAQCSNQKSHKQASAVQASWSHHRDIVDVAASNDDFSTLVAAVQAADLVSTLKSKGPFTVFAPTNAAFSKLPEGTISSLLEEKNKSTLSKILTYHVVAGKFEAEDVINAINTSGGVFKIKTVSSGTLKATLSSGTVLLTDENGSVSAITKTDVSANNGVIHIIDSVLLPK